MKDAALRFISEDGRKSRVRLLAVRDAGDLSKRRTHKWVTKSQLAILHRHEAGGDCWLDVLNRCLVTERACSGIKGLLKALAVIERGHHQHQPACVGQFRHNTRVRLL